jgi:hypothetical protein
VVLLVSWGRCIFRFGRSGYLIVIQSKNKALDLAFKSNGWALPRIEPGRLGTQSKIMPDKTCERIY